MERRAAPIALGHRVELRGLRQEPRPQRPRFEKGRETPHGSRPDDLRHRARARHQAVRRLRRREGHEPEDPQGRVLLHARTVGLWQDHDPAHGRRLRAADRGRDLPRATRRSPACRRTSATSTPCSRATPCSRTCRVWDNVAFGLKRKKVEKDEIKQRVGEALEMVEMDQMQDRKPQPALRAASSSASRSPGRSSTARRCCCSTSRSAPSTRSCARPCSSSSRSCRATSASRSST